MLSFGYECTACVLSVEMTGTSVDAKGTNHTDRPTAQEFQWYCNSEALYGYKLNDPG